MTDVTNTLLLQLYKFVPAECGELMSVQEQSDGRQDVALSSVNRSFLSEAGKSIVQCTEDVGHTRTKVKESAQSHSSDSCHAAASDAAGGQVSFHSEYTHGESKKIPPP